VATKWTDCRSVDPSELETRYSVDDLLEFIESTASDEPSEEALRSLERIREIMESLPPREADFVDLYFFRHLKQTDNRPHLPRESTHRVLPAPAGDDANPVHAGPPGCDRR